MGLRDAFRRKEQVSSPPLTSPVPELTLMRPDAYAPQDAAPAPLSPASDSPHHLAPSPPENKFRRSLDVFRSSRSRSDSASSRASQSSAAAAAKKENRLSRFHRREPTSDNIPPDLPRIDAAASKEEDWERRAMLLARSRPESPPQPHPPQLPQLDLRPGNNRGGLPASGPSEKEVDADIQRAIRLHEEGNLEASTRLFGELADPRGGNNPLSQVLYGLALRHGWGCQPDPDAAVHYLSKAASNAAAVEQIALQAGLKKGGVAKGELVLAIFELANCFRHGWGVAKDPVAAKQYYETAANLGDPDAMNEAAWCYLEGFGCKKDRFAAARYYRLAEKNGSKIIGNSWIWKDKYGPPEEAAARKK